MTEQQQKLYDKLLKKVNEYCLGAAAEDVIAAIDALVESYEPRSALEYLQRRYTLEKQSEPLQAFEELFGGVKFSNKDIDFDKLYTIVETALKEKEEYDNALAYGGGVYAAGGTIGKQLKAFEIINSKKCIHILALRRSANWRAYNEFILPLNRYNGIKLFDRLTQKEYNFLKEVLK